MNLERQLTFSGIETKGDPPLPLTATSFWAGSPEKIELMKKRYEAGYGLFHPFDTPCVMARENRHCESINSFKHPTQALAPTCDYCQSRIIGHGRVADQIFYCCDHCAKANGVTGLKDRLNWAARS